MKTLSRTLWNLRRLILILAAPLLLLPLPLVIGTKVGGDRHGDERAGKQRKAADLSLAAALPERVCVCV